MSGLVGYDSSDEEDVVPQLKSSGNSLVDFAYIIRDCC